MRVIRHLAQRTREARSTVLTLGSFDGVHLGHQAIVARAVAAGRARGAQVLALTFTPHPVAVLAPARAPALIHTLRDRLEALEGLGLDGIVVQRFTPAFAALTPDAFVREMLLRQLALVHVVVGYNVTFGRDRAGTVDVLRELGVRHGFAVEAVAAVRVGEHVVSSTAVRRAVADGDVGFAASLLGRPYTLRGRITRGDQRGRTIGFPTANVHARRGHLVPQDGVYAAWATFDGSTHPAVVNVGLRPTFGVLGRTVEAHVLDFAGELYGRPMSLGFIARLRAEQRFPNVDALCKQIAADVTRAREVLAATPRPTRTAEGR